MCKGISNSQRRDRGDRSRIVHLIAAFAALGATTALLSTPARAQAPPLGTIPNFAIMAGVGISNTGPSVITGTAALPGDLASSTGAIGGFPPGTVVPPPPG